MSQIKLTLLVFIISLASLRAEAPPRIEQNPASVLVVNISDPVTLECRVSGNPQPLVTWFKNDIMLDVAGKNEYTLLRNKMKKTKKMKMTKKMKKTKMMMKMKKMTKKKRVITVLQELKLAIICIKTFGNQ